MSDSHIDATKRRPLLANGRELSGAAPRPPRNPSKFHPVTAEEAWSTLGPQAAELRAKVAAIPVDVRGRHVVFEATLLPNYLAASYSPAGLLESAGLYAVGSRIGAEQLRTAKKTTEDAPTKTILIAGTPGDIAAFAGVVAAGPSAATEKVWETLRQFCEIGLPRADRVVRQRPTLGATEVITWEAVLTHVFDRPSTEQAWADENFAKWAAFVKSIGGQIDPAYRRDVGGMTFVPVELAGAALDEATRFNLLRAIRPMPSLRPFPDDVLRLFPGVTRRSEASLSGAVPDITIATFDGGVSEGLELFRPFVRVTDLTTEPKDPVALRHGSMVTSALLYGPIEPGGVLPDPVANVHHHRVLPVPKLEGAGGDRGLYWILDQIVGAIRSADLRLVSLSIGPNDPVEDGHEPTRWTSELDLLARGGVTFVAAVGNNGEEDDELGYNRVMSPGDMINGISVGATATTRGKKTVRAPYSAVGPGREGQRIAPTCVAFGGSQSEPFIAVDQGGRLAHTAGTSFAAPSVARLVAGLWRVLPADRRTPAHSRAFVTHFARQQRGHKHRELGHGLLSDSFERFFQCAANEVTVLYEDLLPRSGIIAMSFPFPEGLRRDAEISASWTLTFLSDVDPSDASDYAQHGLDITFRPNEALRRLTDATGIIHNVDLQRDGAMVEAIIANGGTLGDVPPSHKGSRGKSETALRARGKWETTIRGGAQLLAGDLHAPRLDVQHLRRNGGQLLAGPDVPPLPMVMLLTLRAPDGVQLYDQVCEAFSVLVPLADINIGLTGAA